MPGEDSIEVLHSAPQISESISLQKIAWKIQKICWALIIVLMVLIALGLFGNGPLSKVSESKGNMTLEYERFSRSNASLVTTVSIPSAPDTAVVVGIPLHYLSRFELESIFPESYEVSVGRQVIYYRFDVPEQAPLTIQFFVQPLKHGTIEGDWTVNGSVFAVKQLIYP